MNFQIAKLPKSTDGTLQFSSIKLDEDYRKKWNETAEDFIVLTRSEQMINNSLYRVGGMGAKLDGSNYLMILKYVEAHHTADIIKSCRLKSPKYLSGRWCIIDKNGVEKVVFDEHASPYLVADSCIYSLNSRYYNIETGEFYGDAFATMRSKEFLFLDTNYNKDKSKCGVMKINKRTGEWEIFN